MAEATPVRRLLFRLLKNGSSPDMAVDGSTPVAFRFTAPFSCKVERLNMWIQAAGIKPDLFGNVDVLTAGTGLLVRALDTDATTVLLDFTGGEPIKTHPQLGLLAGVDVAHDPAATPVADSTVNVRWTLSKAAGGPVRFATGQILEVKVQDDLTGLTAFMCMMQGSH